MKKLRLIFFIPIAVLSFIIMFVLITTVMDLINGISLGGNGIYATDGTSSLPENTMSYILMFSAGFVYFEVGKKIANDNDKFVRFSLFFVMLLITVFLTFLHIKSLVGGSKIYSTFQNIGFLILHICPLVGCVIGLNFGKSKIINKNCEL